MRNRISFFITILLVILLCATEVVFLEIDDRMEQMRDIRETVDLAKRYVTLEAEDYICGDKQKIYEEQVEEIQEGSYEERSMKRDQTRYEEEHTYMAQREYLLSSREDIPAQYMKLIYDSSDPLYGKYYEMPMTRYSFSIYDEQGNEESLRMNTCIDDVDGDLRLFLCQEDVNHDGYMDLRLIRSDSDRSRDIIYLWNPEEGNYIESKEKYQG